MRKVKTKWLINLPRGSTPKIKVGETVACGQVLAEETVRLERVFDFKFNIKKFELELVGKTIEAGKVMCQTGGVFSKKIMAPGTGTVCRIDEFNNLYLDMGLGEKKTITSPIEAKVKAVNDDSLELEFKADEFEGIGLNNDRAWALKGLKWVESLGDLSFADKDKIMVVDSLTPELMVKAEVVGIRGVVVFESCNRMNNKMPILQLKDEDKDELIMEMNKGKRALLNAGSGRLLLVI